MRVLFATDGLPCSLPAKQLVAGTAWPAGTEIQLLRVQPPLTSLVEVPASTRLALEHSLDLEIEADLRSLAAELRRPGIDVQARSAHGRPATVIVDEAARMQADLVVVGSRGRGTFATMLLGSVAAEVVDQAICPVLVARTARIRSIVLADDGSAQAERAATILETWPIFRGASVRVVSVAPIVGVPVAAAPRRHEDATEDVAVAADTIRAAHERVAHARASRLADAGLHARPEVPIGDPAEAIVETAMQWEADLVIAGSRGRSGLERLVLGSVARNVLVHAPCSVLIVRDEGPSAGG